jgi:hypothetical protein
MEQEIKSDLSKAAADAKIVEQDVAAAKSWLSKNWHYAIAFTVGGLFLGLSIGIKVGSYFHG